MLPVNKTGGITADNDVFDEVGKIRPRNDGAQEWDDRGDIGVEGSRA